MQTGSPGRRRGLTAARLWHELHRSRHARFSPLLFRIFTINSLSVLIVLAGFLYLGRYQERQITQAQGALQNEARLFASALSEGAARDGALDEEAAEKMVRRLIGTTGTRGRIFDQSGQMIADTSWNFDTFSLTSGNRRDVLAEVIDLFSQWSREMPARKNLPEYYETGMRQANAYPDAASALENRPQSTVWKTSKGNLVLTAAFPVEKDGAVIGAVFLMRNANIIDNAMREQREDALAVMMAGLLTTFLISLFLGEFIGQPIRQLALAAEAIQKQHGRQVALPDFSKRKDEIGDLSIAFRQMMDDLWMRMDALDQFAADVSHELKNPLTSLRSAVETLGLVTQPEQQRRLRSVIQEDVQRIDRLISDIAAISRLDAELSRATMDRIPLNDVLRNIVQSYLLLLSDTKEHDNIKMVFRSETPHLNVLCAHSRLQQVLRNLIDNALSFSPPSGTIEVGCRAVKNFAEIWVTDEGPGIPDENREKVFQRFYTDRDPKQRGTEKFGGHSGLGLSIVKQIIDASGGQIRIENNNRGDGSIKGARFVFTLPLASR